MKALVNRLFANIIAIIVFSLTCTNTKAQILPKWKLSIGDTLPDIEIKNIQNYKKKSVKVSDFNTKLLILDFWATWCTPCLRAFPKLDSLQRKFGNKIQILSVSYEDSTTVATFLKRVSKINGILPITVTDDQSLQSRFEHRTLPHYVWLNDARQVIAITESEDVNEKNIKSFLESGKFQFTAKIDESIKIVSFPALIPMVRVVVDVDTITRKLDDNSMLIQSTLTKYIPGAGSIGTFTDSTRLSFINWSVVSLYKYALMGNNLEILNNWGVETLISDISLLQRIKGVRADGTKLSSGIESFEWLKENGYCYECKVPPEFVNERYTIMVQDLNRYFGGKFGIIGTKEKLMRKCLALIRTCDEDKLGSKGGQSTLESDKLHFRMTNLPVAAFSSHMALPLQAHPPIFDETNYKGNIDLDINCNLSDLSALNRELEKVGLKFIEKEKLQETAVIRMIK